MAKRGYLIGPIGAIYAWVVILICVHLNPWWNWTASSGGALSYMGDPTLTPYAWVYDYVGMVPAGLIIAAFAVYLYLVSRNRFEKAGSLSFILSGILLVLIGVFHQTPGQLETFHVVFSLWFFLQSLISIFLWGFGLYREGRLPLGRGMVALAIGTLLFYALIAAAFGHPVLPWYWGMVLVAYGFFVVLSGTLANFVASRRLSGWIVALVGLAIGIFLLPLFSGVIVPLGLSRGLAPVGVIVGIVALIAGVLAFLAHALSPTSRTGAGARLVLGSLTVITGVLIFFAGVTGGLGSPPGAVGEVLGILAIDAWVAVLYFAIVPSPRAFRKISSQPWLGSEKIQVYARPSIVHILQLRALFYVGLGLFLFGFSNYYLTMQFAGLMQNLTLGSKGSILQALELTLFVTLGSAIAGYVFVLLGARRWWKVLPSWPGHILLSLTVIVPPVMIFAWFFGSGNSVILEYLLAVAVLLPLAFSIAYGLRTQYLLTDRHVISTFPREGRTNQLPLGEVRSVALRQGWVEGMADVGDVEFIRDPYSHPSTSGTRDQGVSWKGITAPRKRVSEVAQALGLAEVPVQRTVSRAGSLLVVFVLVLGIVLATTLVPVVQTTYTIDMKCALYLNVNQIESDPWPFLHNVSLPLEKVNVQWWSGTPVWVVVLQLPKAIAYQNTAITSLVPGSQANLTTNGTVSFLSSGGTAMIGCVATTSGGAVNMDLTYDAPLAWA
jgi:hypothetical membrane protein